MDEEDRRVLALHAARSMARLVFKLEEQKRFGDVRWFNQWEPDLEQARNIHDRERARIQRERDERDAKTPDDEAGEG